MTAGCELQLKLDKLHAQNLLLLQICMEEEESCLMMHALEADTALINKA